MFPRTSDENSIMPKYTLKLLGPESSIVPLSGSLVAGLFEALDRGARGAVRLRLEGRSSAHGTQPSWLPRASFFKLEGLTPDHSGFELAAPALSAAIPKNSPQYDFIGDEDADKTSLTLFSEGLRDAIAGREDSDTFDASLLKAFRQLDDVFGQGVVSLELRNSNPAAVPLEVSLGDLSILDTLKPVTPAPQQVRIAGKVDAIRHSDRALGLILATGVLVRGIVEGAAVADLPGFFGKDAVVSGSAIFRPSGALLRVEVTRLDPATDADRALFGSLPRPHGAPLNLRDIRQTQGPRSGVAAMIGGWPKPVDAVAIEGALKRLTRE